MVTASKINPALAKEIAADNPIKTDTYDDTVNSMCRSLTNHASGTQTTIQLYST